MKATRTNISYVKDALRFYNEPEIWIGIGKTNAWPGDESDPDFEPPVPDLEATGVESPVAYKRVIEKRLVVPTEDLTNGTIVSWKGGYYRIVEPEDAIAEGAHWVYIRAELIHNELPMTSFRQIGTYTGLKRAEGVPPGKQILFPVEVEDPGYLELLENRKAVHHDIDTWEVISYVREF